MDALPGERVEEYRQGRGQGLALTRLHLGDRPLVQSHAADQLHVEVALTNAAPRRLAGQRKGLGQQIVERLAAPSTLTQRISLSPQLLITEQLHLRLDRIDLRRALLIRLEFPSLAHA